ncbi:UNVERIFIED_CONTAM: hypothetical protein FKN15_046263 [Acipenser sinensis]
MLYTKFELRWTKKTVKDHIINALDDLRQSELKEFIHKLCDTDFEEGVNIAKGKVEGADSLDLADIIVRTFSEANSVKVTVRVLRAIGQNQIANVLERKEGRQDNILERKTGQAADVSPSRFIKAIQQIIVGNNEVEMYQQDDSSYHFNCEEISKADVSPSRFIKAIQHIIVGNNEVEMYQQDDSSYHFNCEEISKGNPRLCVFGSEWVCKHVLAGIGTPEHWESAAHPAEVLQQHKLGGTGPEQALPPPGGFFDCTGNILVKNLLTSGYKTSTKCRTKPKGFGLLDLLGPDLFRKFFNLDGYSLTFVIDVTGSMGDDIAQVKTTSIDLIKKHANSLDAPYNYILVPFSDPGKCGHGGLYDETQFDPPTGGINKETSNPKLSPHHYLHHKAAGLAINATKEYFIGQGKCGHGGLYDETQFDPPTGGINKETSNPKLSPHHYLHHKAAGLAINATKEYFIGQEYGPVFKTQNVSQFQNSIASLTVGGGDDCPEMAMSGLQLALTSSEPRSKIFLFTDAGAKDISKLDDVLLLVESTKSQIYPFLTGYCAPAGTTSRLEANTTTVVNTANFKIVNIIVEEPGSWHVVMNKIQTYTIGIDGKSLLDFSYQIMEEHNGYVLPIQGRPTKGSNYTLSVDVQGSVSGMMITKILLLNKNGEVDSSINVDQMTDSSGRLKVVVSVELQLTFLMIGIAGKTKNGTEFERVNSDLIQTEDVQLIFPPGQKSTLIEGGTLNISVLVVNKGKQRSQFKLQAKDEFSLLTEFHPSSVTLDAGEPMNLSATFRAPANSNYSSSMATFTARSESAKNYLNILIRIVPESTLVTDDTPPQYEIENMNMPCKDTWQLMDECKKHQWDLIFRAWDESSQVYVSVGSEIPEAQELVCKEPVGAGSIPWVSCQYSSSCCYPYVDIIMQDKAGNANVLRVDNRQPMAENQNSNTVKVAVSCATVVFVVCLSSLVCFLIFWRRRRRQSRGIYRID